MDPGRIHTKMSWIRNTGKKDDKTQSFKDSIGKTVVFFACGSKFLIVGKLETGLGQILSIYNVTGTDC
jgi:hypothetical protein